MYSNQWLHNNSAGDIEVSVVDSDLVAEYVGAITSWASVKANYLLGIDSKVYFEMEPLNTCASINFGFSSSAHGSTSFSAVDYFNIRVSGLINYGSSFSPISPYVGGYDAVPGVIGQNSRVMFDLDFDALEMRIGIDGVYLNNGDPIATFNRQIYYPHLELINTTAPKGKAKIIVNPDNMLYLPEGYSAPTLNDHPYVNPLIIRRPGNLGIYGKVSEVGVPGAYRVLLYDQLSGSAIAETWSDVNGDYSFTGLTATSKKVVAIDHTDPLRGEAVALDVIPS